MTGWWHGLCMSVCCFDLPHRGLSCSFFCNYTCIDRNLHVALSYSPRLWLHTFNHIRSSDTGKLQDYKCPVKVACNWIAGLGSLCRFCAFSQAQASLAPLARLVFFLFPCKPAPVLFSSTSVDAVADACLHLLPCSALFFPLQASSV